MKKVKSAKKSMFVFMVYGLLKKIEYINFDYIAWFNMLLLSVLLVCVIFFNIFINLAWYAVLFALCSLPLVSLFQSLVRFTLKSFYK